MASFDNKQILIQDRKYNINDAAIQITHCLFHSHQYKILQIDKIKIDNIIIKHTLHNYFTVESL